MIYSARRKINTFGRELKSTLKSPVPGTAAKTIKPGEEPENLSRHILQLILTATAVGQAQLEAGSLSKDKAKPTEISTCVLNATAGNLSGRVEGYGRYFTKITGWPTKDNGRKITLRK